ncbi:hypothetical protein [Thalassobellus suaedae]|uniref:Uncharacterized protein n=1 Tax=Thalassobellus suaedae TaxID=3074124 RepID=A0ABY9Y6M5_9FLAO|nr:hypothetical protein RHP51_13710 [Flavobacteriaceae bacterium HL-DH14]WNH13520.1 hypothetical protein RHP49_04505 [Flavobacteriaceae bacterium HL-DH10]
MTGEWQVKLDSLNVGENDNWAKSKLECDTINLPRTLDDFGIGKPNNLEPVINNYVMFNLSPNPKTLKGIEGRFVPVFWSPVHFPDQPASMGLLLNE